MASRIQELLQQINVAIYGEEVRGSIHDAIEQCYDDVTAAKTLAGDATSAANQAATNANSQTALAKTATTTRITPPPLPMPPPIPLTQKLR